jgi:hypothetical protein
MVGFRGSPEFGSVSMREQEALLSKLTWYEMTLMEEEHRDLDQSSAAKVAGSSSSEGVGSSSLEGTATEAKDMIDHGGGATRSTFLAKREC